MAGEPAIYAMSLREQKKQTTQQKLVDAASVEFAEVGYAKAHMARISTRAGYGKGTVYNYFPSKYDLLLAVVEHAMRLLTDEIRNEIGDISDPVAKMKRALEVDFCFMVENEALSKVIIREGFAADPQRQVEFLEALAPISELFFELLSEGTKASRFRIDVDSDLTTLVAQGIVGYLLLARWTLQDERMSHEKLADTMMKCFVEGILTR